MQETTSQDYFTLSLQTAKFARDIADILAREVSAESVVLLREGFKACDTEAVKLVSGNFARFRDWRGGWYAMQGDDPKDRIELMNAVLPCFEAIKDDIDLSWSPSWAQFMASEERERVLAALKAFAARFRIEPVETLVDVTTHRRLHYDNGV